MATVQPKEIKTPNFEQSYPLNSYGQYPNCICANGEPFNEVYNICPTQLLHSIEGSCPHDSTDEPSIFSCSRSNGIPN